MSNHILRINKENKRNEEDVKIFNNNKNKGVWFVKYYADWCPHCINMKSEWDLLTQQNLLKKNKINLAEVEETFIDKLSSQPDISGYPTLRLYKDGDGNDFKGERNLENFLHFLEFQTKSFKTVGGKKTKNKKRLRKYSKKYSRKYKKNII